MKFTELLNTITSQWAAGGPEDIFFIESEPGIGKSSLAAEVGRAGGFDHVHVVNASLLDLPDLAGLALLNGTSDVLQFKKSPLLAPLQDTEHKHLVVWEEATDANIAMQNLMCRVMYDRELNGLKLGPKVHHLLLGNRAKDKSGAGRVSTKLSGRVTRLQMTPSLEDWVTWALDNNVTPIGIQFLRFREPLFSAFDPDAPMGACPTPRNWTRAFRTADTLADGPFFEKIKGDVGEGAAAEYTAFRRMYMNLVPFEEIVMNPKGVKVPDDLSAVYATVGSAAHHVKPTNIERVAEYIERLPASFGVMFWNDAMRKEPKIKTTKPFLQWATSAGNVLMN